MTKKDRVAKIEAALTEAHRNRPKAEADDGWNSRVMAQVRAEGRLIGVEQAPDFAQRFVWRFAAVACMLALAFSLVALQTGIGPEQLALNLFMDDPLALQSVPLFAL